MRLARLGSAPESPFPPVGTACEEPNGLLAYGGDLAVARLRNAYALGIFPWYSEGQEILWWSPDPRCGFDPARVHVPRRLIRWLRKCTWTVAFDSRFEEVVAACAAPRSKDGGTWITREMRQAYADLFRAGDAHSVEVLDGDRLVGGLYGVATGAVFCAESMFSAETHGSKVALLALASRWSALSGTWIDAQIPSDHLASLGADAVARSDYLELLRVRRDPLPWATLTGCVKEQPGTRRVATT